MSINFAAVNYLAVLVAGLATFFLGGMWYQALFKKLWVELNGYSEEQVKKMQAKRPPAVFFGGMIVCYLILALVMALLVVAFDVKGASAGALFGFLVWVATAAITMTGHLASDKHIGVYAIDTSYQLIYLVMMGAILGAWR